MAGDTIIATVRPTLRRIAQVPVSLDGELVSTAFCVLRPDQNAIIPDFLFFAVQLDAVMAGIAAQETGASYPAVRDQDVLEQSIPLPSPAEQKDIAAVMNAVRCSILNERLAESNAANLKDITMRTLLTRGLRNEPQKETEIGLVPESWEVASIGSHFQVKHGLAFDGSRFRSEGEYVLLTPGHFSEGGGFRDQAEKTKYYVGDFDRQYLLNPGDLLIAMTEQKSGLLGSTLMLPASEHFLHNQRLGLVVELDEDRLAKGYLYHLLNYGPVRAEIARTSTGSKVKHTSPSRIRAVVGQIPPMEEQQDIVAILDTIDHKVDLHRRKRAVLDDLFKSLLHKLMTGEIRVADLDLSALAPKADAEAVA